VLLWRFTVSYVEKRRYSARVCIMLRTKSVPFLVFVIETQPLKVTNLECKMIIKGSLNIIQTYITY
jgi:hypothetical protein